MSSSLDQFIAEQLKLPIEAVTENLSFASVPAWDSVAHVDLLLALEQKYGVAIGDEEMVELTSVAAIREFIGRTKPEATAR